MAITFRPLGGLGNQLFTYATGRAIADRLQVELHADLIKLSGDQSRRFELLTFSSRIDRVHQSASDTFDKTNVSRLRARLEGILNPAASLGQPQLARERGFWFDPQIPQVSDNCTIDGYFQSWKYFESAKVSLRKEITSLTSPSSWFLRKHDYLRSLGKWTGIHVRRGDYVSIARMGLTTDAYFQRATDLLAQISPSTVSAFVVFSDDIASARELPSLQKLRDCVFIDSPADSPPIETLLLMAASSHLIISNSSFSWWAGWLGEDSNRLVIYPHPWIDYKFINTRDLPLPTWIGVGRDDHATALTNNVGY